MNCPSCNASESLVVDSRQSPDTVKRRRKCAKCDHRWTTFEYIEQPEVNVVRDLLEKLKADLHAEIDRLCIP